MPLPRRAASSTPARARSTTPELRAGSPSVLEPVVELLNLAYGARCPRAERAVGPAPGFHARLLVHQDAQQADLLAVLGGDGPEVSLQHEPLSLQAGAEAHIVLQGLVRRVERPQEVG